VISTTQDAVIEQLVTNATRSSAVFFPLPCNFR